MYNPFYLFIQDFTSIRGSPTARRWPDIEENTGTADVPGVILNKAIQQVICAMAKKVQQKNHPLL